MKINQKFPTTYSKLNLLKSLSISMHNFNYTNKRFVNILKVLGLIEVTGKTISCITDHHFTPTIKENDLKSNRWQV